ncbi:hypothetical protein ACN20G_29895 (plasmid) [Streptomyces sp. BI20]|uniref:hypothetical protein n=1 Tax=Streptomyces sp. BI20 TaxID=3403460 RepID=UPI003C7799B8
MNILASGDEDINNVINELNWAFPIGYGLDQEEIELHFTIPGVANGGAAWIKGMVQKRDIKLDEAYAQRGAARIDIELYCHNPTMNGYGKATARMDTAAGYTAGGAKAPFVFKEREGLHLPSNYSAGKELLTRITNNAKDRDDKACPIGPDWEASINGPVANPTLNRRNYFNDLWSIELAEDVTVLTGQSLVFRPDAAKYPEGVCTPEAKPTYSGKISLEVNGVPIKQDIKHRTVAFGQEDRTGGAWGHVGTLRKAEEIATTEYWSILPGKSDTPINGNAHGFVTWYGGQFI